MKIQTREDLGSAVVLAVDGNLFGGPHADDFYQRIKELIDAGKTTVLVDLANAGRGNSAGLGILIRGYISLKNAGGTMRVFNCSPHVDKMFKVTRFNTIIDVFETEEEARQGL